MSNSNSKNNSSKSQFDILVSKYVNDMVTDTSNPPAEYFNRELEIKFGTIRGSKPISKLEYDNIINKLISVGFNIINTEGLNGENMLRIINEYVDKQTGNIKMSNIRTEINGLTDIQEYCKTNSLMSGEAKKYNRIIMDVTFLQKTLMKEDGNTIQSVDVKDYNFRTSYSSEKRMEMNDKFIKLLVDEWSDKRKIFRYINRVTLTHPTYPVKIDCSIVKSSKKKSNGRFPESHYNIGDAGVFDNQEMYEIEIEIDNDKLKSIIMENNSKVKQEKSRVDISALVKSISNKLSVDIKKCVKYILAGVQQTNYPVSYDELYKVSQSYLNLIDTEAYKKQQQDREGKYSNIFYTLRSSNFIGPSSITLQQMNIVNKDEETNIPNVRKNYTVTDKADGARKLLFVAQNGKLYLITTNMEIQFTGLMCKNKEMLNTIIDGEHILYDKKGNFINLYACFDIYFIGGNDVRKLHFTNSQSSQLTEEDVEGKGKDKSKDKNRLTELQRYINMLNNNMEVISKNTDSSSKLTINVKGFYPTTNNIDSILKACDKIFTDIDAGNYSYETDGLIFTPMDYGVGLTKMDNKIKNFKSTWELSFKWKPPEYNTIDFYVATKKNADGKEFVGNIYNEGIDMSKAVQIQQYKTIILHVGFDQGRDGYLNPFQDMLDDNIPYFTMDSDYKVGDNYKPVPFMPTNPSDPKAYLCNILLRSDTNGNNQMLTLENETFEDNMIVEFSYDADREPNSRWVPLRVRWDKTLELRKGLRNYGNNYHVANNNWHSIHNPITKEMICGKEVIPEIMDDDDVYYVKVKGKSNTRAMRDFHNLYVKQLLIKSASKYGDTLIDFAVGKAGDFPKWIAAKLKFVFGIDLSKDNIQNQRDGACARYLNYKKQYTERNMPKAIFVNGNSGLPIRDKDNTGILSDKEKVITNAIFGIGDKQEDKVGKAIINNNLFGIGSDGFNISSIQFAIHYMFKDVDSLHNLLKNVSQTTKVDGYFIGTSYDGKKIFDALKSKEYDESIYITSDNNNDNKTGVDKLTDRGIIWEVTKKYKQDEFPDTFESIGYAIDVYQETIGKVIREYLVNYDYLIRIMEDYGFVPLETTDEVMKKMGISNSVGYFEELYNNLAMKSKINKKMVGEIGESLNMNVKEKQISFYNRFFIFKKVRDVTDIDVIKPKSRDAEIEYNNQNLPIPNEKEVLEEIKKDNANVNANVNVETENNNGGKYILLDKNPKRSGSDIYKRYEVLKKAKSISQAYELGRLAGFTDSKIYEALKHFNEIKHLQVELKGAKPSEQKKPEKKPEKKPFKLTIKN